MAMGIYRFRFEGAPPTEAVFREALAREVGKRRATEWNVELMRGDHDMEALSTDGVGLVYSAKVLAALGGTQLHLPTNEPRPLSLPAWTATPWVKLPLLTRLKLWIGPTRF